MHDFHRATFSTCLQTKQSVNFSIAPIENVNTKLNICDAYHSNSEG